MTSPQRPGAFQKEPTHAEDITMIISKRICCDCVRETYLSLDIFSTGPTTVCDYCSSSLETISLEELSDRVESAFSDHYVRTRNVPEDYEQALMADDESEYFWEREGTHVLYAIQDAVGCSENAAQDLLAILSERHTSYSPDDIGEEQEFDPGSYYQETLQTGSKWDVEWRDFEQTLKTQARFFNQGATQFLDELFQGLDKLTSRSSAFGFLRKRTRKPPPIIVSVGPRNRIKHFYRARTFHCVDLLKKPLARPDLELGPPPNNVVVAGRMSAPGISVFYGASNHKTAIAEVRPPVGSWVVVAKFNVTRPLRLLDLNALDAVHDQGSIFDPTWKERLERVAFLRRLGFLMTRPVMPGDEVTSYLPTQVVADYLANACSPKFDGILFKSVQVKNGLNVVLFRHACRLAPLELRDSTNVDVDLFTMTEEGAEPDFCVTAAAMDATEHELLPEIFPDIFGEDTPTFPSASGDQDGREPALKVDVESMQVHEINWVGFTSRAHRVQRRYRHHYGSNF
ncbi:RES family NAD+ phosphorylase [Pseudomonas sp. SDO55104_S430]